MDNSSSKKGNNCYVAKWHYYAAKKSTIMPEKMHYYAGIMLDAPHIVLCSKLCRHNVSAPTNDAINYAQ